ncbi:hypothetical protein DFH07DRAFT_962285 [Mycena maculata]|uniref:Uncharacterized protein n=1 Tax=Mycena maculata TaxID=230809 RepID=A0AAD7ITC8_9AGAR|nr:hypothetical protein DFH07DRAFT_962285 [Mycena maculata]
MPFWDLGYDYCAAGLSVTTPLERVVATLRNKLFRTDRERAQVPPVDRYTYSSRGTWTRSQDGLHGRGLETSVSTQLPCMHLRDTATSPPHRIESLPPSTDASAPPLYCAHTHNGAPTSSVRAAPGPARPSGSLALVLLLLPRPRAPPGASSSPLGTSSPRPCLAPPTCAARVHSCPSTSPRCPALAYTGEYLLPSIQCVVARNPVSSRTSRFGNVPTCALPNPDTPAACSQIRFGCGQVRSEDGRKGVGRRWSGRV